MNVLARVNPTSLGGIHPFDEPASELSFCDVPLATLQEVEAERAGLKIVDVDVGAPLPASTVAVASADTLFSEALLREGIAQAGRGCTQVVVEPPSALDAFLRPHAGAAAVEGKIRLPLFFGALDGKKIDALRPPEEWLQADADLALNSPTAEVDRTDPYGPPPHELRICASDVVAGRVTHWLHALNLGLVWLSLIRRRHGATGRKNAVLGKVKIHPSALVEGSVLGDGAEVEAGASVINSYIGPGVKIADHAIFVRCAVDTNCHTLIDTHMRRVVAYAGSTLSNLGTSDLLLGRKIFITTGVSYFQPGPGKTVMVDGEDSLRPILGGAVGHGAILGARTLFEAGQAVPAFVTVVGRPDEAVSRLTPEGLARAHAQHGDPTKDA